VASEEDSPRPRPAPCACEPGAEVVDPTLLAFLSKARAVHHEADLAEDADDRRRAISILERLVGGDQPGGVRPAPEVAEVIADTRARLADLRSALGDFETAARDVDAGLVLAQASTHFRGRLFEVRGLIEERREKALKAKGDIAGAERARKAAIQAFEQAIAIQDEVISRALRDAGPD
jgi:tetratricopeptide (TPR) repeat protein